MTDTTAVDQPRVHRPTPSWSWTYDWRHRGRFDVHGHRKTTVRALLSSNEEAAEEPVGLPNEIVIDHEHGESRTSETIRMPRSAAQKLVEQLQAALAWDGK